MPDDASSKVVKFPEPEKWRELAKRASTEKNSEKLISLVRELCEELDLRRAAKSPSQDATHPHS